MIAVVDAEQSIRAGVRNILNSSHIDSIISSKPVRSLVEEYLTSKAVCVRGILFDKTLENNWNLPFHQDTKIAVIEEGSAAGYNQYSKKDGVVHVCPPASLLERQIALRIHLDACTTESGPVRVIPDSETCGILDQDQINRFLKVASPIDCVGGIGSILVFRSLLLHGSDRSTSPLRRRVLHLEFCDADLDPALRWKWCLPISS